MFFGSGLIIRSEESESPAVMDFGGVRKESVGLRIGCQCLVDPSAEECCSADHVVTIGGVWVTLLDPFPVFHSLVVLPNQLIGGA